MVKPGLTVMLGLIGIPLGGPALPKPESSSGTSFSSRHDSSIVLSTLVLVRSTILSTPCMLFGDDLLESRACHVFISSLHSFPIRMTMLVTLC